MENLGEDICKHCAAPFSVYMPPHMYETSSYLNPVWILTICSCFSLSELQHLRKTHQCSQHDDVIRWGPSASRPVHRWQCCTSKPHVNPFNPVPHKQRHTHFEFMESHWITAIIDSCVLLLFFCPLYATKICTWEKKNKVNIELGDIELGLTSAPSRLMRAQLKISQYSCQSANQSVNEVSFLECFSLSPRRF